MIAEFVFETEDPMPHRDDHVCPVAHARGLDNRLRRWLQNPRRIVAPYVREGMTVVDIGCGPGFFTAELVRLVGPTGRVFAVDLQPAMLAMVRSKLQGSSLADRVVLHEAGPHALGLSVRADFALAFYMVHEVPDQAAFLAEVRGMVAPAGQLLVVEPPFHVSRRAFEATLVTAERIGFRIAARPHVTFSRAALLRVGDGDAAAWARRSER